ncbi:MAG: molybdopterin-guanine dinucleotide biosynthesis protein B [Methylotenera sp.]
MHNLPILGICAAGSNAGKTTLITQLIPELAKRRIRVSVIKHAHHQFDIDYPGKDSYQIRESGAVQTLIASGRRWALITEMNRTPSHSDEADLNELLKQFNPDYADLILVEGFKSASIPKIEVYRASMNAPLLAATDKDIIAVASDLQLDLTLPTLDLNDISAIADFIMLEVLKLDAVNP